MWVLADEMVLAGMVDVKNKRCEDGKCMKRPLFGFDGEKARFCKSHRLAGKHLPCTGRRLCNSTSSVPFLIAIPKFEAVARRFVF